MGIDVGRDKDANGGVTSYAHDAMNRRNGRTDPLNRTEMSLYDGNGNLTQFTDRRGEVTVYLYDGLNRRIFADFGKGRSNESTISYTWDGGDRMTQAVDSIAGRIRAGVGKSQSKPVVSVEPRARMAG